MTRLDHAFIKIYADRRAASPAPPGPHRPASGADAPGQRTPGEAIDLPTAASADNASQAPASVYRVDPAPQSGSAASPSTGETPVPQGRPVGPPHMRLPAADAQRVTGGAAGLAAGATRVSVAAAASQNEVVGNDPGGATFQPMLLVDKFAWPAVCCRLGEAAADELDRLADALVQLMARGKRVVAIGACRRGEGATTVLLCAARRLAELGLNLVLADAHLADPQIASRLGLLPESGWEDVLAGRLPLEEAVIESANDRLAVLPLRETAAEAGEVAEDETRLVESIRTLATHYDLVLLDPGPLEELGVAGASLACGIGSRLDAIVLVHHGGITPAEDLDEVRGRLAGSEIVQVGVVENFCGQC
jgi:Mrp family chromosome partitioning ATPase